MEESKALEVWLFQAKQRNTELKNELLQENSKEILDLPDHDLADLLRGWYRTYRSNQSWWWRLTNKNDLKVQEVIEILHALTDNPHRTETPPYLATFVTYYYSPPSNRSNNKPRDEVPIKIPLEKTVDNKAPHFYLEGKTRKECGVAIAKWRGSGGYLHIQLPPHEACVSYQKERLIHVDEVAIKIPLEKHLG